MESIEEILKSGFDRGYRQIMQFSTIRYNLHDSVLIIDCPTFNDTDVLLNKYGEQLCLRVAQLNFSLIEMRVAGETLYSYPPSLVFKRRQ